MKLQELIPKVTKKRKPIKPILEDNEQFVKECVIGLTKFISIRTNGAKQFTIQDDRMNDMYFQIFTYLNRHEELFKHKAVTVADKWDLAKGLFLIGAYGSGKTVLLDYIYNKRNVLGVPGNHCTAFDLSLHWVNDPAKYDQYVQSDKALFIDEIGDEPKKTLHFGNQENVVYRALKTKLDRIEKQSGEKTKLFATSNLSKAEFIESYGDRVWDRIKNNFNVVIFQADKHKSHRG